MIQDEKQIMLQPKFVIVEPKQDINVAKWVTVSRESQQVADTEPPSIIFTPKRTLNTTSIEKSPKLDPTTSKSPILYSPPKSTRIQYSPTVLKENNDWIPANAIPTPKFISRPITFRSKDAKSISGLDSSRVIFKPEVQNPINVGNWVTITSESQNVSELGSRQPVVFTDRSFHNQSYKGLQQRNETSRNMSTARTTNITNRTSSENISQKEISSDLPKKVGETRKEIEQLKTELETLINCNIQKSPGIKHLSLKIADSPIKTLWHSPITKRKSVTIQNESKDEITTKTKQYDSKVTREFIKKKQLLRKEKVQEEQQKKLEMQEQKKQKLQELRQRQLQLLNENVKKASRKSTTKISDTQVAQDVNNKSQVVSLRSKPVRPRSFDRETRSNKSNAQDENSRPWRRSRSVSRELNICDKKDKASPVKAQRSTNEINKKSKSQENIEKMRDNLAESLKNISKFQEKYTDNSKKSDTSRESKQSNKHEETSKKSKLKEYIPKETNNKKTDNQKLDKRLIENIPIEVKTKSSIDMTTQTEIVDDKLYKSETETDKLNEKANAIKQRLETIKQDKKPNIPETKKTPVWLQPPSSLPYPYNFISAVKKKLDIVTRNMNTSLNTSNTSVQNPETEKVMKDVSIQIPQDHKKVADASTQYTSKNIQRSHKEIKNVDIPQLSSPPVEEFTSFLSHKLPRKLDPSVPELKIPHRKIDSIVPDVKNQVGMKEIRIEKVDAVLHLTNMKEISNVRKKIDTIVPELKSPNSLKVKLQVPGAYRKINTVNNQSNQKVELKSSKSISTADNTDSDSDTTKNIPEISEEELNSKSFSSKKSSATEYQNITFDRPKIPKSETISEEFKKPLEVKNLSRPNLQVDTSKILSRSNQSRSSKYPSDIDSILSHYSKNSRKKLSRIDLNESNYSDDFNLSQSSTKSPSDLKKVNLSESVSTIKSESVKSAHQKTPSELKSDRENERDKLKSFITFRKETYFGDENNSLPNRNLSFSGLPKSKSSSIQSLEHALSMKPSQSIVQSLQSNKSLSTNSSNEDNTQNSNSNSNSSQIQTLFSKSSSQMHSSKESTMTVKTNSQTTLQSVNVENNEKGENVHSIKEHIVNINSDSKTVLQSSNIPNLTKPAINLRIENEKVIQDTQSNPNEIHLKFQAEVHLLNSFNKSLQQFVAVEKSLFDIQDKENVIEDKKSVSNNIQPASKEAQNQISTINFKRGCDVTDNSGVIENLSTFKRDSDVTNNVRSIENISTFEPSICTQDLEMSHVDKSIMSTTMNSIMSKQEESVITQNKNPYVGMSIGMFDQLIKDEDSRLEHFKAILKLRDKALLDRTKGELAWLEIQKKQLRDSGQLNDVTMIKKKQRGLIIKLEQERHEMQRLKQAHKQAAKERKNALKEQKNLIKHQLSSTDQIPTKIKRLSRSDRRQSGPLKVYRVETISEHKSETTMSRKSSITEETVNVTTSSMVTQISEKIASSPELPESNSVALLPKKLSSQTEKVRQALLMREAALEERRKEAESLLEWHKRLKEEEARVAELERLAKSIPQNTDKSRILTGFQLNQIWKSITDSQDKKFDETKKYKMSNRAMDRFYQNARKVFKEVSEEQSFVSKASGDSYTSDFEISNSLKHLDDVLDSISQSASLVTQVNGAQSSESSRKNSLKNLQNDLMSSRLELLSGNKHISTSDHTTVSDRSLKTDIVLSDKESLQTDSVKESLKTEVVSDKESLNSDVSVVKSLKSHVSSDKESLKTDIAISDKEIRSKSISGSSQLKIDSEVKSQISSRKTPSDNVNSDILSLIQESVSGKTSKSFCQVPSVSHVSLISKHISEAISSEIENVDLSSEYETLSNVKKSAESLLNTSNESKISGIQELESVNSDKPLSKSDILNDSGNLIVSETQDTLVPESKSLVSSETQDSIPSSEIQISKKHIESEKLDSISSHIKTASDNKTSKTIPDASSDQKSDQSSIRNSGTVNSLVSPKSQILSDIEKPIASSFDNFSKLQSSIEDLLVNQEPNIDSITNKSESQIASQMEGKIDSLTANVQSPHPESLKEASNIESNRSKHSLVSATSSKVSERISLHSEPENQISSIEVESEISDQVSSDLKSQSRVKSLDLQDTEYQTSLSKPKPSEIISDTSKSISEQVEQKQSEILSSRTSFDVPDELDRSGSQTTTQVSFDIKQDNDTIVIEITERNEQSTSNQLSGKSGTEINTSKSQTLKTESHISASIKNNSTKDIDNKNLETQRSNYTTIFESDFDEPEPETRSKMVNEAFDNKNNSDDSISETPPKTNDISSELNAKIQSKSKVSSEKLSKSGSSKSSRSIRRSLFKDSGSEKKSKIVSDIFEGKSEAKIFDETFENYLQVTSNIERDMSDVISSLKKKKKTDSKSEHSSKVFESDKTSSLIKESELKTEAGFSDIKTDISDNILSEVEEKSVREAISDRVPLKEQKSDSKIEDLRTDVSDNLKSSQVKENQYETKSYQETLLKKDSDWETDVEADDLKTDASDNLKIVEDRYEAKSDQESSVKKDSEWETEVEEYSGFTKDEDFSKASSESQQVSSAKKETDLKTKVDEEVSKSGTDTSSRAEDLTEVSSKKRASDFKIELEHDINTDVSEDIQISEDISDDSQLEIKSEKRNQLSEKSEHNELYLSNLKDISENEASSLGSVDDNSEKIKSPDSGSKKEELIAGVSHIDVRKRVSEILADATPPRGVKSPRLQDLYVTTYDIMSPSPDGTPEIGSPTNEYSQKEKSLTPGKKYLSEAEELLRKQLEIEQEIKRLEQQQQENIPYCFMREIPNKPPPPYKPPEFPATPKKSSVIPTQPEQVKKYVSKAADILYAASANGTLEKVNSPRTKTLKGEEVVNSQAFVFDLCKEIALDVCKSTNESNLPIWKRPKNKFSSLILKKPSSKEGLERVLNKKVLQLLNFEPVNRKDNLIIRWSRKKRDHVDEILVLESQTEEAEWTNYDLDEQTIKDNLTSEILDMLVTETAEVMSEIMSEEKTFKWA